MVDYKQHSRRSINTDTLILWFGFMTVLFNTIFRMSFAVFFHLDAVLPSGQIYNINFIAIVCVMLILYIKRQNILVRGYMLIFVALLTIIVMMSNNFGGMLVITTYMLVPMIFMSIKYENCNHKYIQLKFYKLFYIFFSIVFVIGIVDYFLGGVINQLLADRFSTESWGHMIITENSSLVKYRFCSIVGSPLMMATFALLYIVLFDNYVALQTSHSFCRKSFIYRWCVYVLGFVAIILSGSRAALFLAIVYIAYVLLFTKGHKKEFVFVIILGLALANSNLYINTIGTRINAGAIAENGRILKLLSFLNGEYGQVNLLKGEGFGVSRLITAVDGGTNNFEFPFLMFLFDYGILGTVLIYTILLIIPVMALKRNKMSILKYLIVFVMLNTYNGIAQWYDFIGLLAFLFYLLEYEVSIEAHNSGDNEIIME